MERHVGVKKTLFKRRDGKEEKKEKMEGAHEEKCK